MRAIYVQRSIISFIFLASLLLSSDCRAAGSASLNGPVINLKLAYPQTATVELGLAHLWERPHGELASGPFLSYEPGINGQKVHLGYAIGSFAGSVPTDLKWLTGRISASYYRQWRDANSIQKGEDFYGIELVGSRNILLVSAGLYYGPDSKKTIGSLGVGIGW